MTTTQPTAGAMRAAKAILDRLEGGRSTTSDQLRDIIDRATHLPELIAAARNIAETHPDCACDDWMIVAPGERCSYCQLRDALALTEGRPKP